MKLPFFAGFDGQLSVAFSSNAASTFAVHQQRHFWQHERGGILLASSVGAADGYVEVSEATPPHRKDRSGRSWLKLDHMRVLQEIREGFGRSLHFVGYWHTHPETHPHLSSQDVAAMVPAVRDADMDLLRILMVVVGGHHNYVRLDVCVVERSTGAITRLIPTSKSMHDMTSVGPLGGAVT